MSAVPQRTYTLKEYLELERGSDDRFEYFNGIVFAMSGGSANHARIALNVSGLLVQKLRGGPCETFNSEMRIKVPAAPPYRYPDASVVCGKAAFDEIEGQSMLLNPTLIVEVLSPTTAAYDLGEKFAAYQSVDSFREYLLISQDRPYVIHYVKQQQRKWLRTEVEGLENQLQLESFDAVLSLRDIYERVDFET